MRTRSQARKRRQQQVRQTSVESPNLEKPNPPIVTMEDNRTMAQLPREHPPMVTRNAIVVPRDQRKKQFEIKARSDYNHCSKHAIIWTTIRNPHAHIRYFNKITSTMKFPNVPSIAEDVVTVKVERSSFLPDIVVPLDYVANPWVPLILETFLKTARVKIDSSQVKPRLLRSRDQS
ncbi:hypothetical protein Tco_0618747 [Tanacetum coccineum]